jgi:hypothetical protein
LVLLLLSSNQISGSIPTEIGLLLHLTKLDFRLNMLSGSMPSQLGLLSSLAYLDVSSDRLTGVVPSSLCNIQALQTLYLCTYNRFGCPNLTAVPDCLFSSVSVRNFGSLPPLSKLDSSAAPSTLSSASNAATDASLDILSGYVIAAIAVAALIFISCSVVLMLRCRKKGCRDLICGGPPPSSCENDDNSAAPYGINITDESTIATTTSLRLYEQRLRRALGFEY